MVAARPLRRADRRDPHRCTMRYVGQGHEIAVALPAQALTGADDEAQIRAAYDAEYTRFCDRPVPGSRCRGVLSFAVTVATRVADVSAGRGCPGAAWPRGDPHPAGARHPHRGGRALVGS